MIVNIQRKDAVLYKRGDQYLSIDTIYMYIKLESIELLIVKASMVAASMVASQCK